MVSLSLSGSHYPLSRLVPELHLKWPNDLVTDTKLAGILQARGQHLVIGCGVNLKNAPDIENKGLEPEIWAARLAAGLKGLPLHMAFWMRFLCKGCFEAEGTALIIDRWAKHSKMTGKLSAFQRNTHIDGHCEGVDEHGSLRVTDAAANIILLPQVMYIMADKR